MDAKSTLWTVSEVAKKLRVDETSVRRWVKSGALEAITLPHVGERCAYRIRDEVVQSILRGEPNLPRNDPGAQQREKRAAGQH